MLTVAIHQPNYLPYLGYFEKIAACDVFVLLDSVTFTHNDWRNRNRVKTRQGWRWLTVPVVHKNALHTPLSKIEISDSTWRKKHWRTMEQSYCKAPHFARYRGFFKEVYEAEWRSLADLDSLLIVKMCEFLGVPLAMLRSSELNVAGGAKTDLLVNICKEAGADRYFSGAGAKGYMDCAKFEDAGVEVAFQEFKCSEYGQLHGEFVPDLSAVDYLFNCGRWHG